MQDKARAELIAAQGDLKLQTTLGHINVSSAVQSGIADAIATRALLHVKKVALLLRKEQNATTGQAS